MEGQLARINLSVFKEPRGVMKILQFVFSICAFATTTNFSSFFTFSISCTAENPEPNVTITEEITYPFQIDRIRRTFSVCGVTEELHVKGDFSSDAKFFVAVGVLALLYVLVAVVLYCCFSALYENNDLVPIGDFVVHVVFVILWFAASCAWSNSINGLSSASSLDNIRKFNYDGCPRNFECRNVKELSIVKLVISVVFGFLNVFIWASNLWFLYKETRYFKERKAGEEANGTQ